MSVCGGMDPLSVCRYVCIHVYAHVCMCAWVRASVHVDSDACAYTCVCARTDEVVGQIHFLEVLEVVQVAGSLVMLLVMLMAMVMLISMSAMAVMLMGMVAMVMSMRVFFSALGEGSGSR